MGKKLYVGNLPFGTTEQDLGDAFAACGSVESVKLITDRETGRSKGFGFVEYTNDDEAQGAIEKFHGTDFGGRNIVVNEARPMESRSGGGGGGARRGGGGGGRGGRPSGDRW